jgi:predicted nucleotidyltransferase
MNDRSKKASRGVAELPAAVQKRLEELTASLEAVLGDDLQALLLHGSAARGGYREGESDLDLIVVLKDASRPRLDAISNALQLARYSARIETMILTVDEIPRAADVFPLLYDDIRRCHILVRGTDPFSGLQISDRHRRLRVEQELRDTQIRFRRAVVDGMASGAALAGTIVRRVSQIRSPLAALLALHGENIDDDLGAVLAAAGKRFEVDTARLLRPREAPADALEAFTRLLDAAVEDADNLGGAEEGV